MTRLDELRRPRPFLQLLAVILGLILGGCSLILPLGDEYEFRRADASTEPPLDGRVSDGGLDAGPMADACAALCDGVCVNTDSDPNHCGGCGIVCSAPTNAAPVCLAAACDFICDAGFIEVSGACAPIEPPRPVAPMSTATVTSRRPTFHWELAPRSDGARLELCEDRACTTVLHNVDVEGSAGGPPENLPAGVVFWRVYGRVGDSVGLEPSPTWQAYVGVRSSTVDTSWGTKLDLDGDGLADLAVGAPRVESETGRVHIYSGGPTGVSSLPDISLIAPDPAGSFGIDLASAGDVNGDGFGDLIVGASGVDSDSGRAYLFLGSATGVAGVPSVSLLGPAGSGSRFGEAVAGVGDVNGDGFADVVVGAPGTSAAYLFLGTAAGPAGAADTTLSPGSGEDQFGRSVAGAGDVNGDGLGDVVVGGYSPGGSSDDGHAYVFRGDASGLTAAGVSLTGPGEPFGSFGASLANAGDIDADGYADVIVGAPGVSAGAGAAFVYLGASGGISSDASVTIAAPAADGAFGTSVSAGDITADGYSDLAVGAVLLNSNAGRVYVFEGAAGGLATAPSSTIAGPDGAGGLFGIATSVFDVNGDGLADVSGAAVGAASWTGAVYVYRGTATGVASTPQSSLTGPDGASGRFGLALP